MNKRVWAGSLVVLAGTGMSATSAMADESPHGHYSQSIEVIRDVCPTVQDIDVIVIPEVLDEARAFQCNEIRQKSQYTDESAAPALPILGQVVNR
ncbi:hypothetical protein [Streptomyces candidus]|uniref:Secreted protein n=1 Tax=Streptomyces candidus TaxID=67283 RepID=A0A7X0LSR2_9ACTN|nr:hypothetical protein [Streptomyces candidus]MBB6439482.1 hypothetical protein [Streptomyces candidus]